MLFELSCLNAEMFGVNSGHSGGSWLCLNENVFFLRKNIVNNHVLYIGKIGKVRIKHPCILQKAMLRRKHR